MRFFTQLRFSAPLALLAGFFLVAASGCVGLTAHMLYFVYGNQIPAAYEGLEDKRVAVVCKIASAQYNSNSAANDIAKYIGRGLAMNVKDIEVVPHSEVMDWRDQNSTRSDDRLIAKGVDADILLLVEIESFSLREGGTIFRAHATYNATVIDMMNEGKTVWGTDDPEFSFPVHTGIPATEISQDAFQKKSLKVLASDIVKNFHAYDADGEFGRDISAIQ